MFKKIRIFAHITDFDSRQLQPHERKRKPAEVGGKDKEVEVEGGTNLGYEGDEFLATLVWYNLLQDSSSAIYNLVKVVIKEVDRIPSRMHG